MRPLLFVLAMSCCFAQTADSTLSFEVASVKVTGSAESAAISGSKRGSSSAAPGADPILFRRPRATLASLLMAAYDLRPQQVIGPNWLTTERYDILARVPDSATARQQMIMLRNLLADRFALKQHREQRELPIYEMVVAKGGPKLKQPGETRIPALTPDGPFGLSSKDGVTMIVLWGRGSMSSLAARLSRQADRLIVDRTALTGDYDIDVRWSAAVSSPTSGDGAADPGISLASALESQLGLKLESKKAPVDVLVVDHAEKVPTDN
ncbi:MAG TPA: TIGR03435 family protein [Verrucomicrobiae bacterium]|nr:TIGR03435 family protein [Verrucomicrobiae bacterium]